MPLRPSPPVLMALALLSGACSLEFRVGDPPDPLPSDSRHAHGPARRTRSTADKETRRVVAAAPAPAARPPVGVTPAIAAPAAEPPPPVAPSGPIVLRLYPMSDSTRDPFGERAPPAGVQLYGIVRTRGHTTITPDREPLDDGAPRDARGIGRTAEVRPRGRETLAEAIARVRPWFERLGVADNERFLFDWPRAAGNRGVDRSLAYLVREPAVAVRRSDIHDAVVTDFRGDAFAVQICWSLAGDRRVPVLTRPLVGTSVAFVVGDSVVFAPYLRGPVGGDRISHLTFLSGDRALGEQLVEHLLEGSDEVVTEPSSSLACGELDG